MNPTELDELIQKALSAENDDAYWEVVRQIQRETPLPQLWIATQSLLAKSEPERELAIGGLHALSHAEPALRKLALHRLHQVLEREDSPSILASAVMVLAHFADSNSVPKILPYANHSDAELRRCVAHSLARLASEADFESHKVALRAEGEELSPDALLSLIVDTMLRLSADPDPNVRDWATFAFTNELEEQDSAEIRSALRARLRDPNENTQAEAILGLALRRDDSVVPIIEELLAGERVGELVLDAVDVLSLPHLLTLAAPFRD